MATATDTIDTRHMMTALALARRGLGQVWPNPAVGCVITDQQGRVAGRGWTQPGGRPHGETEAIARAGDGAKGGTAYVSLEPCNHTGKTGPCTEALIRAGVKRVVIAAEDPDPRVSGSGVEALKKAGIDVRLGVCRVDAERLNGGFISRVTNGRPLITLKVASTLDGCIATHTGESQWITGEVARNWGHGFRAGADVILTGASTVRADDPALTCRLPGMEDMSPVRVVMDSRLATPLTAKIVATAKDNPTWIVTASGADSARRVAFADCGVDVIEVKPDDGGRPDVHETLTKLAERGVTRVLAEGGGALSATLFRAGVVDRIVWFRSPDVIGGDGIPVTRAFGVDSLDQMASYRRLRHISTGRDMLEIYEHNPG